QIEIKAAALHAALERARREDNRRQAGRRPETFLRAAITGVDGPPPDVERLTAERADRVDNRQRAVLARDWRQRVNRVQHPSGGFGLHDRNDVGTRGLERFPQRVWVAGSAPLHLEARDRGAVAFAHLSEAIAEIPR